MACEALGIDYKYFLCDLQEGDNFKPEYLKINPQHTVPTLNDNGFIVTESRPIATYLSDKYGKDDKLYPKDLGARYTALWMPGFILILEPFTKLSETVW